jgi:hypothetical protein
MTDDLGPGITAASAGRERTARDATVARIVNRDALATIVVM